MYILRSPTQADIFATHFYSFILSRTDKALQNINILPQTMCITACRTGPIVEKLRVSRLSGGKKMEKKMLRVHSHMRFRVKVNFVRHEFVCPFFPKNAFKNRRCRYALAKCIVRAWNVRQLIATNRHSGWRKGIYSYSALSNKFTLVILNSIFFSWNSFAILISTENQTLWQFALKHKYKIWM